MRFSLKAHEVALKHNLGQQETLLLSEMEGLYTLAMNRLFTNEINTQNITNDERQKNSDQSTQYQKELNMLFQSAPQNVQEAFSEVASYYLR